MRLGDRFLAAFQSMIGSCWRICTWPFIRKLKRISAVWVEVAGLAGADVAQPQHRRRPAAPTPGPADVAVDYLAASAGLHTKEGAELMPRMLVPKWPASGWFPTSSDTQVLRELTIEPGAADGRVQN